MVDLATFRTFPRASPGRQSAALVAEPEVLAEKGTLTEEALPTRFDQELRARRRAARTDMRQSEAWAEPEIAQPVAFPSPSAPEAVAAPLEASEAPLTETEHTEAVAAVSPGHGLHSESPVAGIDDAEKSQEAELLHEDFAVYEITEAPEAAEHFLPEMLAGDGPLTDLQPEPEAPPVEDYDQAVIGGEELSAHRLEPFVQDEEPAALVSEFIPDAPATAHASRPMPIEEFLAQSATPPPATTPVITPLFEASEAVAAAHEALLEEAWLAEPAYSNADDADLAILPPEPIELDPTPFAVLHEPVIAEVPPVEVEQLEPMLPRQYDSESLTLDYRLLGLANPLVYTVTGRLGDAAPVELTVGRTGIYRPQDFRAAPWSGFAYDVSSDGRTGLVLGTRILTARGEIPVEDLVPGDTALALRGPALIPIVWIGRSIAVPPPVEIAAGAFGPGRPGNTLRVGADHPIFMQSMPVLARDLVNGDTIRTLDTETAELFHIDVGLAEVLLAEGVPLSSGCR